MLTEYALGTQPARVAREDVVGTYVRDGVTYVLIWSPAALPEAAAETRQASIVEGGR